MAVVIRKSDKERVPARQVTDATRAATGTWLHSLGHSLINVATIPSGSWIVSVPSPKVYSEAEFDAAFDTPVETGQS